LTNLFDLLNFKIEGPPFRHTNYGETKNDYNFFPLLAVWSGPSFFYTIKYRFSLERFPSEKLFPSREISILSHFIDSQNPCQ